MHMTKISEAENEDEHVLDECKKIVSMIQRSSSLNKISQINDKTEASITKFGRRGKIYYTFGLNQFESK